VVLVERGGGLCLTVGHDRLSARGTPPGPPGLGLLGASLAASGGSLVLESGRGFAAYSASLPVAE
jgi:hypothetical protein